MPDNHKREEQLEAALKMIKLPAGIQLRCWQEADFPAIQRLSLVEGWTSPTQRPVDALLAWQHSWPALVAMEDEMVVGYVRGLTDGAITTYIADLLVDLRLRGRGIGRALLDICHFLYPTTRLELFSADDARTFYKACGFRVVYDGMRKSYV
jgi:predicted N-acetyltransferase YhbS